MYPNFPYSYLHRVATKNFDLSVIALPEEVYTIENNLNNATSVRTISFIEEAGTGSLVNATYSALDARDTKIETKILPLNGSAPWAENTNSFQANDITASPTSFPSSKRYLPHIYFIQDTSQSPDYKLHVVIPTVAGYVYMIDVMEIGAGSTARYIQIWEQADTSSSETLWAGESEYFDYEGLDLVEIQVYDVNNVLKAKAYTRHGLADVK